MTFPVGLRLFMSVAIDQLKNVKFGYTKLSLKPLSDLRKTEGYLNFGCIYLCFLSLLFVAWWKEVGDENKGGQQM